MAMVSYAVYDVDTGEVVHLHAEPAELGISSEEIIRLVDPSRTRRLNIVQAPKEGLRSEGVRVVDGELRAAQKQGKLRRGWRP